jgi:hypothetical protein
MNARRIKMSNNREHALYAFIVFSIAFNILMLVVIFNYTQNFYIVYENQMMMEQRLNQMASVVWQSANMLPAIAHSHNNLVQSFIISNPEAMETGSEYAQMMAMMEDEGKLDRFYNCSSNFTRFELNYPLFDGLGGNSINMIGYETVVYNADDNYEHVESFIVTQDYIIYDKKGCARLKYDSMTNKTDIFYYGDEEMAEDA